MVRIKHRYLLLNILYPDTKTVKATNDTPDFLKFHAPTSNHVTAQVFLRHLRSQIAASFGDQGLGLCQSSLKLVYFSNATSTAILRVSRAHYQIVWATLTYMTEVCPNEDKRSDVAKNPCTIRVVRVSGTVKKAIEELLRRNRRRVIRAKLAGIDEENTVLTRLIGDQNISSLPLDQNANTGSLAEDINENSDSE